MKQPKMRTEIQDFLDFRSPLFYYNGINELPASYQEYYFYSSDMSYIFFFENGHFYTLSPLSIELYMCLNGVYCMGEK